MSYTLSFWSGDDAADCMDTYRRLNTGERVEHVALVDKAGVERALSGIDGWRWSQSLLYPPGSHLEGSPVFDIFVDTQAVTCTGYGVEAADINTVIDVMRELGFRLYDPQTNERFA
ncbi:MAG: hypothetical protein WBA38_13495 [Gordonia sp. (in: high G+C Gram-positive bacteria)]|uniref:hypothetical protein n=1 Tax=Gordonia sp. (in: high G+C Gram-positive bacteria) TaxID=84139 RepID=UPI003C767A5B